MVLLKLALTYMIGISSKGALRSVLNFAVLRTPVVISDASLVVVAGEVLVSSVVSIGEVSTVFVGSLVSVGGSFGGRGVSSARHRVVESVLMEVA